MTASTTLRGWIQTTIWGRILIIFPKVSFVLQVQTIRVSRSKIQSQHFKLPVLYCISK